MNAQEYYINIRPGNGYAETIKISQYDVGRPLACHLMDGAGPLAIPSGSTVTIRGTKPSGLGFSENCTISGSTASVSTTLAMSQEFGFFPVELVVAYNDDVIATGNAMLLVEMSPHQDGTTDGTAEDLQDIYEQLDDLKSDLLEVYVSGTSLIINGGLTDVNEEEY